MLTILHGRTSHGNLVTLQESTTTVNYVNNYHWPAFNVADVAISVGAVGLIIDELFFNKDNKKTNAPS